MSEQYKKVAVLVFELEAELRRQGLWSEQRPSDEALSSTQPFAVDTLTFTEWLQFIFVPKMEYLLNHSFPLPKGCHIKPMAEEALKDIEVDVQKLLEIIEHIDAQMQ